MTSHPPFRLSVVIPTWCEATTIAQAVVAARAFADEGVVVDCDSPDGTADLARRAGVASCVDPVDAARSCGPERTRPRAMCCCSCTPMLGFRVAHGLP